VPVGSRILSSPLRPDWLWAHPASYPIGTGTDSRGVIRPERKAHYLPPTNAEVKNIVAYTSTPHYVSVA
jgi:hypothetical protein